jgi:predicted transcriptional regulator
MADHSGSRVALMAIHPEYANAIVSGEKKVEFRKRAFAQHVEKVLIYATSPVQKVIGEFGIARTVVAHPDRLWESFGDIGQIEQADFDKYYGTRPLGVAFVIAWAKEYETPHSLGEMDSSPAVPQSYSYLTAS